ncbi:hypothetical protein V8C42DRAFT_319281 [Trichoderma barbatum]
MVAVLDGTLAWLLEWTLGTPYIPCHWAVWLKTLKILPLRTQDVELLRPCERTLVCGWGCVPLHRPSAFDCYTRCEKSLKRRYSFTCSISQTE